METSFLEPSSPFPPLETSEGKENMNLPLSPGQVPALVNSFLAQTMVWSNVLLKFFACLAKILNRSHVFLLLLLPMIRKIEVSFRKNKIALGAILISNRFLFLLLSSFLYLKIWEGHDPPVPLLPPPLLSFELTFHFNSKEIWTKAAFLFLVTHLIKIFWNVGEMIGSAGFQHC